MNPFLARGDATTGIHLSWRKLKYEVPLKDGNKKTLIHDIDGQVPPGGILALMGASGAGKSTLLNLLGQHIQGYTGDILLNGRPVDNSFRRVCGFVTQDVPFLEFLTVTETLMYTARLRLPGSLSMAAKRQRVEEVIALLDLHSCANTMVGKAAEPGGISGGERRRLAMACELLFDPQLLLLDEVTSGLDSASAMRIALILRKLAAAGKTIIATIHQPRPEVMAVFDQVLLLAQGKVAYYGPSVDGGLLGYFEAAGYPFPLHANPSDVMLDLVNSEDSVEGLEASLALPGAGAIAAAAAAADDSSPASASSATAPSSPVPVSVASDSESSEGAGAPGAIKLTSGLTTSRRQTIIDSLVATYAASPYCKWAAEDPAAFPPPPVPTFGGATGRRYPTSWFTQQWVVAERAFVYKLRNPDAVASQFISTVLMAVIVGSVYYSLPNTGAGARDRLSAIAFILLTQSFIAFDQVIIMPQERAVMLRDSASGAYSTSAFFFGRTNAEWPVHTVFSIVVAIISSWMFGLRVSQFGVYLLVIVLTTNAGAALLTLIGAISSSMAMGNGISTLILVFATLFNGFYISQNNVHVVYRWLFDVSFPAFGVRAAAFNELSGLTYECTPDELAAGCTGRGEDLLAAAGVGHVDVWQMCGLLFLETVIFRVLAFLAMHFMYTGQTFRQRLKILLA